MKKNLLWLFLATICLFQVASAQNGNLAPATRGYTIGPGDEITVKVLGEKDFDAVVAVDENGNIELPFFDKPVPAMCKTERELRSDVTALLGKYLRAPQVGLSVTARKSRPPVTVSGEVSKQQQVDLTRKTRLWELITFSGGITENAGGVIEVYRTQPPICAEPQELTAWKAEADANNGLGGFARMYSISTVQQGRDDSNPIIYPGDIINVQRGKPVYIIGNVKGGGGVMIKEGGLQLMQAVAMVGGVGELAKTKDVKIYRKKSDSMEREIISVNLDAVKKQGKGDVALQPYDIVEVGKTNKSIGQILLEAATGSIGGGISTVATGGLSKAVLY